MHDSSKEEILQFLSANKSFLCESYGVSKIGIFGSFSQNQQTPLSDIDIIVDFQKGKKNIHSFLGLKRFLEENFNRKIDLGLETTLKAPIRDKVKKDILYA
jgi:hypothetical protein